MRLALVVVALVFACGSGCVRSVAQRGTGWWRVTTNHVELATDVDPARAITAGWAFEDLYRALEHVFPQCSAPPITERVSVIMLASPAEYDSLAPPNTSGFFRSARQGIVGAPPTVVVRSASGTSQGSFTQIYTHELTHRFVARCMPSAPTWLNEGLAEYFETMRVGEADVVVGVSPYRVTGNGPASLRFRAGGIEILQIGADHIRSPTEVTTIGPSEFYSGGHVTENYAGAWALVHMLTHTPELRARFAAYLAALPDSGGDAALFARSFADVQLDAQRARYLRGPLLERRVRYEPAPLADPPADPLAPSDAHLLLAALLSPRGDEGIRRDALAHIAIAAEDPRTRPRAALLLLELGAIEEGQTKASYLAALAAEYPDDLDVLSARADFEVWRNSPTNEGRMLLDRFADRDDLASRDLARAADLARNHRHNQLAVAFGRAAVARGPSDALAHLALSRALFAVSRMVEAEEEVRLAWNSAGHGVPSSMSAGRADAPVVDAPVTDPPPFLVDSLAPTALPLVPGDRGELLVLNGSTAASFRASALASECAGFVGAPVAVLDVAASGPPFVIRTRGVEDMVLVLEDTEHGVVCDDDSGGQTNAALFVPGSAPRRLVVRVGTFRPATTPVTYDIVIERADARLDPASVPQECGMMLVASAPLAIGTEVVLGRHRPWLAPDGVPADPIRELNWVPAMDAFVGRHARVIALAPVDAAGCPLVRVDADEGHWLWRMRDLLAP